MKIFIELAKGNGENQLPTGLFVAHFDLPATNIIAELKMGRYFKSPPKIARSITRKLQKCVGELTNNPDKYKRMDGGSYGPFLSFLETCLEASRQYPDAELTIIYNQ